MKKKFVKMIIGYIKMGKINLKLSKDALIADNSSYENYIDYLAESENSDNKKRGYLLRRS